MPDAAPTPSPAPVTYRPGTIDDAYNMFGMFEITLADLVRRLGFSGAMSADDPTALAKMWQERQPLYEHMARTADQCWLAEQAGQLIGFGRSIIRGGNQELTELFVRPGTQSSGVGRELLRRAFPDRQAKNRTIIASPDVRAQALYLKAGVYPRFSIYYFGREPESQTWQSDLEFTPMSGADAGILELLGEFDDQILEHQRAEDHRWWLEHRQGYLYRRDGRPVGYGYLGRRNGPFLLLEAADYPAVLAHAETTAAAAGFKHFGIEVPMVNQAAVDHLLARRFRMDSLTATMMTDRPYGRFENYIVFSPPFMM